MMDFLCGSVRKRVYISGIVIHSIKHVKEDANNAYSRVCGAEPKKTVGTLSFTLPSLPCSADPYITSLCCFQFA